MPIRVAHVLEATEGGTQRWLEDVALGLDAHRVSCAVICSLRRNPDFEHTLARLRRHGVETRVVDMRRAISPLSDAVAACRLARLLSQERFDIIHAHSAKAGMLTRVAARVAGLRPVVYSPHAFPFLARGSGRRLYRCLESCARPLTDVLLAVSEAEADLARTIGYQAAKVVTISNGVRTGAETSMPNKTIDVGCVTAFRRQKDPDTFIRACAILHARDTARRFIVYGDGPGLDHSRNLVSQIRLGNALQFAGHVPDAATQVTRCRVFVCSTHYEGLSYSLLDAMAAGLPVVASRVPGVEGVIRDMDTGLLVPEGDSHAMADAIEALLHDEELAARLGAAAWNEVRSRYALDMQLERLTSFYEQLSRTHRGVSL